MCELKESLVKIVGEATTYAVTVDKREYFVIVSWENIPDNGVVDIRYGGNIHGIEASDEVEDPALRQKILIILEESTYMRTSVKEGRK